MKARLDLVFLGDMLNLRKYGKPPYNVIVIHGGPGARGQMAPVARELSSDWGVLELLQTKTTLEGQLQELHDVLRGHAALPVTIIGSSWGAMLGYIFTAGYRSMVRKLVLVGSGVYADEYAGNCMAVRLSRLSEEERAEADSLMAALDGLDVGDQGAPLERLGELCIKADAYDPITLDTEVMESLFTSFKQVWDDACALRRDGKFLTMGEKIECPVVAIHGSYDPQPAEGVRKPLSSVVKDFRFISLDRCGHLPWIERHAREGFFELLRGEL